MKMCDECFELYDESFNQSSCPKHHCYGDIVEIDSEIAWEISTINKSLLKNRVPIKTAFCCSAHLPKDTQAYIAFQFSEEYFDEDEVIEDIHVFGGVLQPAIDKCNVILAASPNLNVIHPYTTSTSVIPFDKSRMFVNDSRFRLFINDMKFKYNPELKTDIARCRAIIDIQTAFKFMLLDIISIVRNNHTIPNVLKRM